MRYVSERILYRRLGRVERQLQVCSPGHVWTRDGFCPCGDGQVQSTAYANAYAERFVRTIKESCLNRMILVGERSLRRAIGEFVAHDHYERNHQGRNNQLLICDAAAQRHEGPIACRARLGGLLKYYHRLAA